MLTEEQKQELDILVASMQAQNASNEDIQAAVDAKKAELLSSPPPDTFVEEVKTEAVVEDEIAPATAETVVTESQSDLGLSELQPDKLKRFNQGEFKLEEKEEFESFLDLKKQQENKRIADKTLGESIENIQEDLSNLNFDQLDYKQKQYVQDIAQQYY